MAKSPNPELPAEGKAPTESIPVHDLRKEQRVLGSWSWCSKIGAVLLNITCTYLVVTTLLSIDGTLLSSWHLMVSPTTVIAILTTIGKMALLMPVAECIGHFKWLYFDRPNSLSDVQAFDEARRGARCASKVIWEKRGANILASIGCVIAVLSLAFEPTAQQILNFPSRMVQAIDGTASIGVATQFEMPRIEHYKVPILKAIEYRSPSLFAPTTPFQSAVLAGLTGGTTPVATNCSTPYCQFGDVTTLGLCANCEDFSDRLIRNCTHEPSEFNEQSFFDRTGYWNCSFLVDVGHQRNWSHMVFHDSDEYHVQQLMTIRAKTAHYGNPYWGTCGGFASLKRKWDGELEWNYDKSYLKSTKPSNPASEPIEAHQCSWSWCERTITNLSVVNGELHNSGVKETPLLRVPEYIFPWLEQPSWTDEDVWEEQYMLATDESLTHNYTINWRSELSIFAYLTTLLNKELFVMDEEGHQDPIAQLLRKQDLRQTGHNIAMSLSNALRNPANANVTTHHGMAFREEVFIDVHWIWLSVPIILTVTGVTLLVICIILRDASTTPLLKSSALPTLFHEAVGFSGDDSLPPKF